MVYSTRRFVVCLSMCHFVLVVFSPFSIASTSLGKERANLSVFRTFVRFVLVWICRFPLPLGVWEGLQFVIVALPGLFSYLYFWPYSLIYDYRYPSSVSMLQKPHLNAESAVKNRVSRVSINTSIILGPSRSRSMLSWAYCKKQIDFFKDDRAVL